jgi:two-component system, LytTR family, sensor kinase
MDSLRADAGRLPLLPAALVAAAVLGAIAAGQHHYLMVDGGGDLTARHALVMGMPYWFLWILLAPLIAWLIRRVPFEGPWLAPRLAVHLLAAVTLSLLHGFLQTTLRYFLGADMGLPSLSALPAHALWMAVGSLTYGLPGYCAVLSLLYAANYYRRFRERERAASQLAVQLAQARMDALRSQLNPHFFFNAMNSIAMLVRARQNDQAVRALAGLSDLLRYVLQENPPERVPLAEELGFLERYLAIERVRFQDRLQVTVEADPETLEASVPNLILQPLVENAIRHGISRRAAAGLVRIGARRDGTRLELAVQDDGPGPDGGATPIPTAGVGLRNTRARLLQLYGDDQSLELIPAQPGGTIARIRIPFQPVHAGTELAAV